MVNFAPFMKFFAVLFLVVLFASCNSGMHKILKSKDPVYKLRKAEEFYAKKKYSKAQTVFEDVIPYYKTSAQFEDLYYKYAYSAYYQENYLDAENLFKNYLESFPTSPRAEEVEYMRAYCYYKQSPKPELDQSNTYKAIGMFQTFINTHPGSLRNTDANRIIEELRKKLETKEYKSAQLYYDLGQYRAAGINFITLLDNFPESNEADAYKLMAVKSFFKFADMSVNEKKVERFERVVTECNEFLNRYPGSKLRNEVEEYIRLSNIQIQKFSNNEQIKTAA